MSELGTLSIVHAVRSDGFAGVERHIATLAVGQARRGHRVAVIGGHREAMRAHLRTAEVTWMPAASTAGTFGALLHQRGVSIVNVHMTAAELAAVLARPVVGAPIVSTRHFARRRGGTAPVRLAGRLARNAISAQIAISRYVANRIEGEVVVVPPGVPVVHDLVVARNREPVVLVLQRLEPEKRTDFALEAWAVSGLAGRGWRLEVAGSGSQRANLEQRAAELDITDSCTFLGRHDDTRRLLARAGILLAPCPIDGFGLSVVEAMAAGVPVVAVDSGGHTETVGRVDGAALYPPDNLVAAGRLLAELAADPRYRDDYGAVLQAAQRERFTLDRQVETTLDVYRSVLR